MHDTQLILTVAARAGVCQRTAQRALQGLPIKGLAGGRVRRALVEMGLRPDNGTPATMAISSIGQPR